MHLMRWKSDPVFRSLSQFILFARRYLPRREETAGRVGGIFTMWQTDPWGNIVTPIYHRHNILTNQGANWIRDIMFKAGTAPATDSLKLGLFLDSATPSTSSVYAAPVTGEASGNGYVRTTVTTANWNAATQGQANNTAAPATFTASGGTLGGGAVNEAMILNETNSKLLCYASQTGAPFTVPSGSSLNTTYSWTIS